MSHLSNSEVASQESQQLTDSDFAYIADLAQNIAGLSLPPSKAPMLRARLQRRLRPLDIPTISEYCDYLRQSESTEEIQELVSALTTNVTNFYREKHHFDYLSKHILPNLIESARDGKRLRIWSAGCSTGEEPVSIALDLLAACPEANELDIRILATDIDQMVLKQARQFTYSNDSLKTVIERHGKKFLNEDQESQGRTKISDHAMKLISYRPLNLMEEWPMKGPFQIVFCRNVVIYFNLETQNKLWPRFRTLIGEGGHLFLGHSERLEDPQAFGAEAVATTAYHFSGSPTTTSKE